MIFVLIETFYKIIQMNEYVKAVIYVLIKYFIHRL